jgi:hypothetical protein
MLKYFLLWFPMVALAVANGAARELTMKARLGELRAHQVSTVSLIVIVGLFTWAAFRWWPPESWRQAAEVGVLWLLLTLAFEFLFGHYVAGHPWSRLMHDYNVMAGRLWVFVPLWIVLAPVLMYRVRK